MKKPMRRLRLARPADAFLPLALLAATLLGRAQLSLFLYLCLLGGRLLALSTAGSLRAAFALEPSMSDVRGSVRCALLAQPVGSALLAGGLSLLSPEWLAPKGLFVIGAGLLLNWEHVFYEYLFAEGDAGSATLSRIITSVLVFAGIQISGGDAAWPAATACCAAAMASGAVALALGGGLKGKLNARPLRCAPAFLLQDALYPAAFAAWLYFTSAVRVRSALRGGPEAAVWLAPFFAGLAVYSACRTPFRRSRLEARPLNLALLVTAALGLIAALPPLVFPAAGYHVAQPLRPLWHALPALSAALLLAALCAFLLFGRVGRED